MKLVSAVAFSTILILPAPSQAQTGVKGALTNEHIGLLDAGKLNITTGMCSDCASTPQSLWFFRNEIIAAPMSGTPVAGISSTVDRRADLKTWAQTPAAATLAYPSVTWIAAPQIMENATLAADGKHVTANDGAAYDAALVPKIPTNLSYADATTTAYLHKRQLRLRGTLQGKNGKQTFVARTTWPADYAVDLTHLAAKPIAQRSDLKAYVQDPATVKVGAVTSRLIWERTPGAGREAAGKPVLGIMLNGAQGDDDESLAGHFGIATGTFGPHGEWADWAMNNIYTLDSYSEKGIIAGTVPMDNYLTDLNSGQQFYRPSYMLVAVLKDARTAVTYQGAIQRTLNHFYRHDFVYDQAADNCAGVSMDVLRDLGWHIPDEGPTSRLKAVPAYAYVAVAERSLKSGRGMYDNLNEEQTRLLPARAFDAAGWDMLQLVGAAPGMGKAAARTLSTYEQQLKEDVVAIMLVKIAQIPSSRAWGSAPVFSFDEYMQRTPANHADWKIVPVAPRPFPAALRASGVAAPATPSPVPLPIAGIAVAGVLGVTAFWRRRNKMRRGA